ncbi:M1 family metallopeptidase [Aridibaculum aurantiacum]|uniref:M1 family metallopeptidase n=1 Tax=Aridibaculum aurantiacum TaxID=2810307 RepID=UPI001A970BA1|nr:M1 family metallopeptidase [Aridibaculum aurantiacum]
MISLSRSILVLVSIVLIIACKQQEKETKKEETKEILDPHSAANPATSVVKHLDLDIEVNFTSQQITGVANWQINNIGNTDNITFDTKGLTVHSVKLDEGEEARFAIGDETPHLGTPLVVKINQGTKKVSIHYTTSKDAGALQWLTPQQTAGKKLPFLFTQSQPILARSWVPCQDGPAVRFTYSAKVKVPQGLMAVMSAENPQQKSDDGIYTFRQPNPIPSYLMALAVGDIAFKAVDERTGVYAEPAMLEKAAWEFADMGKMVAAAEKLYGPYRWGRYDVLVLPPSFPYGGMENPMLTFATPTVIAGDRSLVSLVAHELAHSWSGNLVTNATWDDMWLNEGFTTYFERRIIEAVYGKEEAKMLEVLGRQDLYHDLESIGDTSQFTQLKTNSAGMDPDVVSSNIPYEKGYFFLRTIEELVGRARFDAFLKKYFTENAFHSKTTEQFLEYLKAYFADINDLEKQLQVNDWVYKPGIPNNIPPSVSPEFAAIDSIVSKASATNSYGGLSNRLKSTNQLLYFISQLPASLTSADMKAIDKEFGFTQSGNAEIQTAWYTLALRHRYQPAYPAIDNFLTRVGRRKFLMPLYKEMVKTPEGREMAERIYAKARSNYHPVAYTSVDALLK